MSWRTQSLCTGSTHLFYEGVFRDEEDFTLVDPEGLALAQKLCRACPVLRECAVSKLEEEAGLQKDERDGVTAGMTPGQRWSIERRGTLRCKCGHVRNPLDLIEGKLDCPRCSTHTTVPVVTPEGDRWAKRHTTLARKLIAWLIQNTQAGDKLPSPTLMVDVLGASIHDVLRVYEGLVADGTLSCTAGRRPEYRRVGVLGAADSWYCPYLTN